MSMIEIILFPTIYLFSDCSLCLYFVLSWTTRKGIMAIVFSCMLFLATFPLRMRKWDTQIWINTLDDWKIYYIPIFQICSLHFLFALISLSDPLRIPTKCGLLTTFASTFFKDIEHLKHMSTFYATKKSVK